MIFIVRMQAGQVPPQDIKMVRQTPSIVADSTGSVDFFCLGDPDAATTEGWPVVPVHDGWYADDSTGGMAIWGQGLFWEVRDTPFTVVRSSGPEAWPTKPENHEGTEVNVRQAIFRG
jgi:hypothetical protein